GHFVQVRSISSQVTSPHNWYLSMTRHPFCRGSLFALSFCCLSMASFGLAAEIDDATDSDAVEVVGTLRQNSKSGSTTPYIVVDRWGVVHPVRPAAGVSLERYLDKNIRLQGTETPSPDGNTSILEVKGVGAKAAGAAEKTAPPHSRQPTRTAQRAAGATQRTAPPPGRAVRPVERTLDPDELVDEIVGEGTSSAVKERKSGDARRVSHEETLPTPTPDPGPDGGAPSAALVENTGAGCGMGGDCFDGGCDACGGCGCAQCCNPCGPPGRFWVRAEALAWWTEGMFVPPLVTTGPSVNQPGFLNTPGTVILFGNEDINDFNRAGMRLIVGTWFDPCQTFGIEGEYLFLGDASTTFTAASNGNPILSRPFFDLSPTQADPSQIVGENVEQVASPGSIAGSVTVDALTQFRSAGVRLLMNLCCADGCCNEPCRPCLSGPNGRRVDFLLGYRYLQLNDDLNIQENLVSLIPASPGSFLVTDSFDTRNTFNGVELGGMMKRYRGRWSLDLITKIALGNTHETVNINGSTVTTQNGSSTTATGGLLAQTTNIGSYSCDQFAVVPELGATLGFQLTQRL